MRDGLDGSFPVGPATLTTLAAIDIGTNAIRLAISSIDAQLNSRIVQSVREPVRLGREVFTQGGISEETISRAVDAFRKFGALISQHGAAHVKAVATSAVREALNSDIFVDRVLQESGIEIEVISAQEEARLIHLAVSSSVELGDRVAMLIDIGGGSVEITIASQRNILLAESYKMGSVRLLEILDEHTMGEERFNRMVVEYVDATHRRMKKEIGKQKIQLCVGTGGSIESMGDLRQRLFDKNTSAKITAEELTQLVTRLQSMTTEQRIRDLQLRPDRADVIVPAAIVLDAMVKRTGVGEVLIPGVGLKDGVLLDLANRVFSGPRIPEDQIISSALQLGRKFGFDEEHATAVARFSMQIFDETSSLHNLGSENRLLLQVASLLHDIGYFLNVSGHHKHTYYLLTASPMVGLTAPQAAIVANIARYHRKSLPKVQHEHYRMLPARDRVTVSKLAGILRLADALDYEHGGKVNQIEVRTGRRSITLKLRGEGDLLLEKWALSKKSALFESVLPARVSVDT
jgi:exopolyphosphatase/guanosine-5'-triphosphate,3'-diphosphate pyrophosphatase